jgi:inorganic pyrophosphatase
MEVDSVLKQLPDEVEVLIETARWSPVKRHADSSVAFITPVPCPCNYGCIPGLLAGDGDPLDAVVLGPRISRGARVRVSVVDVVDFRDNGLTDPKVICKSGPITDADRAALSRFFTIYAIAKRAMAVAKGESGETRFAGFIGYPMPSR